MKILVLNASPKAKIRPLFTRRSIFGHCTQSMNLPFYRSDSELKAMKRISPRCGTR